MTSVELINIAEIKGMSEGTWTSAQQKRAENLLAGVMNWIARKAPCLLDGEAAGRDEAREIVAEAILRAIDAGTSRVASTSETIGPDSRSQTFVDRAALPTLTAVDQQRLKQLCPGRKRRRDIGTIGLRPRY